MNKNEAKRRFGVFLKAGVPYTVAGMAIVFAGIWLIKTYFRDNEYVSLMLLGWLAVFWFVYQPMFRRRIEKVKRDLER